MFCIIIAINIIIAIIIDFVIVVFINIIIITIMELEMFGGNKMLILVFSYVCV